MEYIIKVPHTFEKENLYLILLQNFHYICIPNYNKNNLLHQVLNHCSKKMAGGGSSDLLEIFFFGVILDCFNEMYCKIENVMRG